MLIYIYLLTSHLHTHTGRVFAIVLGGRGATPGHVVTKTQKMVFDAPMMNTLRYQVGVKVKWCNPGKVLAFS